MAKIHIVQSGESLSQIAQKYGIRDWKVIYNLFDNSNFRQKRPDPNFICPGDQIVIPEKNIGSKKLETNRSFNIRVEKKVQCSCTYPPIEKVVEFICEEMRKNLTSDATKKMQDTSFLETVTFASYRLWYTKVKSGGDWDHKAIIIKKFGQWVCDLPNAILYRYDIWSNIHYGYIGLAVGFGEWELLSGAGIAQLKSNVPEGYWKRRFEIVGDADFLAALDDPGDQVAIKVGFELWKMYNAKISIGTILDLVRSKKQNLATKKCNQHN